MTVSHGVKGQLISEARICIYSDIKALNHYVIASQSQRRLQRKASLSLGDRVIQLPGVSVVTKYFYLFRNI